MDASNLRPFRALLAAAALIALGLASCGGGDDGPRVQPTSLLEVSPAAAGEQYWRLIEVRFADEQESGGKHHIYVDVLDESGNVYVADAWQSLILIYDPSGNFITAWGDTPDENGGMFSFRPTYLALDSAGNVFATDYYNNRVHKFDATGALIDTWGVKGGGPGEFS